MSSEPATFCAERDELRAFLAELGRAAEEFTDFVTAELDEVGAASSRLYRRERELAERCDEVERQATRLAAAQQRLDVASGTAEQCAAELRDMAARFAAETGRDASEQIAAVAKERERLTAELQSARATAEAIVQNAAGDLAAAGQAVARAREELAGEREKLSEAFAPVQEAIAAQLAAFAAERAEFAAQLDAAAAMFAEQAAEAQRRAEAQRAIAAEDEASEHAVAAIGAANTYSRSDDSAARETISDSADRATWWNELKQLRTRLGHDTARVDQRRAREAGLPAHAPHAGRHPHLAHGPLQNNDANNKLAETGADPELDSMIAQFETLQQDLSGEHRIRRFKEN